MIIARSPLRISLGGGGTDLPSYYQEHGGFLIAGAIDKYVYATVMRPFEPGIYLKYSSLEQVKNVSEVKHPIIREALSQLSLRTPQVEITTLADIPSGTGLGSSGSFTTALLKALYTHQRQTIHSGDHPIHHNRVVTALRRQGVAIQPVRSQIDNVPGLAKRFVEIGRGGGIVFNNENFHDWKCRPVLRERSRKKTAANGTIVPIGRLN
jgi:hypothetical protein